MRETSKVHTETALEVDNCASKKLMSESSDPGTFVSKVSTTTFTIEKLYRLFVVPTGDSYVEICKTYTRHGNSLCIIKNCTKNHRKSVKMELEEGQLRVSKSKDAIFAEPTSNVGNDFLALQKLLNQFFFITGLKREIWDFAEGTCGRHRNHQGWDLAVWESCVKGREFQNSK